MSKKPLQWHPAFQAVLQIELIEDREYLQFLKEYNLTDKPLRIDTLVIKMEPGRVIRKKIGRIFRQYNVVEYKGPDDYHSVNDFYKVIGYTSMFILVSIMYGVLCFLYRFWYKAGCPARRICG